MPKILQILKERTTPLVLVCLILGIILVSNLSKLGAVDDNLGATVLRAPQGGTGISSATTSDIGKALIVSSTNPFQYTLGTVASSGGGGTTTLNATFVGFGNSDNTVTGTPTFTFNSSTNQLSVTNLSSTSITTTNLYVSGTTTLGSNLIMTHSNFLTVHGIKGDASDGLYITANNGTAVADFGVGNTANSIFNGGVNIDGQTRLATSLTGLAYLTSGVVSATSSLNALTINNLTFTNATGTSVTTTNLSVSGALALPANSITDAMVVAGLTISGGTIDNSPIGAGTPSTGVFTSITSTNSAFATTSITGGFFQTDFTDCDADNQTVAYDVTTGKFGCGDDDSGAGAVSLTNTLLAFGNTDNTITSSTGLSFITSTNRLVLTGTVSSTNGLFLSVTTTNIAIGSDSISDITGTGLEINAGSLQLTTPYQDGSAYDSRFVNIDGDAMTGPLSVNGESSNAPGGSGLFFGYSPDGTGRVKIELSGDTESYIDFTDTGLDFEGRIHYDQATNLLSFVAGGAQTFHIDGTTLTASNTAILGSFTQTGLGDCDADNQTVSYDITTGAFGCGDDDSGAGAVSLTNTLLAFGDAANQITSSTALSFNTTSLRLIVNGTVSSTNGLFINATSTNFFATNGSFTRATSTDFNASGLSFTNANGTSLTSTNYSGTRAVFTSVTSTNLSVSGPSALAGLTFTNATGTGQLRIATTTVTGGFFQTDLTDCTSDTAAVSYNATTGKFGCGDDDTSVSTVSTTLANARVFTDLSPATFADNNTTELFNDATRPNITPQSANNPVLINVSYMIRGASATDNDFVIRVIREDDPGSTTPTCDLTSDARVGASSVGGTLISAFTTNLTDHQTANGTIIDFPATTTAVYYTICTSASSTVSTAPTSSVLHVGLTEIQGAGSGPAREYTQFYTASTTWTKPVTSTGFVGVRAWCVGGGGGGGGAGTADRVGGGGGGGGAAFEYIPAASLTSTAAVTVGVAGTAGAAGNNDGVAGGTSSFGTFITCTGGGGGNDGNSGSTGGAGGVGSGGDFNSNGRAGTDPGLYTDSYRGYGGCAGCNYGDPTSIQDSLSNLMAGSGLLGMYAGGAAAKVPSWSAASYTGGTGAYFGAGGGGGQKAGGGADAAGGAGRQGVVVIVELYN